MRCQLVADLLDLFGEVAEEGRSAVGAAVVSEADGMDKRVRVCFIGEGGDGLDAVGVVAVA